MHPSLKRAFILIGLCFAGLIFATVWTVNVATSSHTQPVEKDYYEKGLKYEAAIAEQRSMISKGYEFQGAWLNGEVPLRVGKQKLQLTLLKRNSPIVGATLRVRFEKSATDAFNRQSEFKELQPGIYEAELEIPMSGAWSVTVFAKTDEGAFERTKQLSIVR
ncbi:FixH family protein [Leptospira inadai serovar Lyme str. 10]|uniref:FixH family protein n=2 Tax=Leptospira inadai serovar Lyme TaxID=293084 RepID=V6HTV7_9LEPT|nr:FixH family protein [Leptospira inadai]EQA36159.1 FixH family protein [Leptospira inadai serovar Lyme str. 10]PNV74897.1 nitrogen fixation protein FixH [Leptospira inadai serovar Lyme]